MRRNLKEILLGSAVAAIFIFAQQATAATTSSTFNVSGTIEAACTVIAENLQFGVFAIPTPEVPPIDSSSGITVTCPPSVGYSIKLTFGNNPQGTDRRMAFGSNMINYNLYLDTLRTLIWGDGTGNSRASGGMGTGTVNVHTVYGRIQPNQSGPPGTYTDTITVTITY